MLISVVFKKHMAVGFDTQEFIYRTNMDLEIGDVVLVETRYGLAIAKVAKINLDENPNYSGDMKQVLQVLIKEKDRLAKLEQERIRKEQIDRLKAKIRRNRIKDIVREVVDDRIAMELDIKLIDDLTREELDEVYKNL